MLVGMFIYRILNKGNKDMQQPLVKDFLMKIPILLAMLLQI